MFRRSPPLLARPALDDAPLHATLTELRPTPQLHGLGTNHTRPPWHPAAHLLRTTPRDWDLRTHRVCVLAQHAPPTLSTRWTTDRPDDPDALTLHAHVQAIRAAAQLNDPTAARDAEHACYRAAEASPEDPTPWLALLQLLHAFAVPPRDAVPVWTEAVTRAPWHRAAYHHLVRYLSPRAHGTVADLMDFAHQAAARAPHGSPLALLPLAARIELVAHRQRLSPLGASGHWTEPRASDEIDAALNGWFRTGTAPHAEALLDLNILAFALIQAHRPTEAAPVFRRIGRRMTSHPWDVLPDPQRTFLYWRDHLAEGN
ncbi:hypothetical protein [Streptomyces griseus]|uniref:hypothetical protein n=1 Tax=Streptomyces griseus TaxID=1911 RepID=UPI00056B5E56|nr:hypothetical protein [Streptomyces griseus]